MSQPTSRMSDAEFTAWLGRIIPPIAETAPTAGFAETAPETPAVAPAKELHQMEPEEWRAHAAQYWPETNRSYRGPATISDLLAGGAEGGAA